MSYGKPVVARMPASEAKLHNRGMTAGGADSMGRGRRRIGMDEAEEWMATMAFEEEEKLRKRREYKKLTAAARREEPRARLRAGAELLLGLEQEQQFQEEWQFAQELTRTYEEAAKRGAVEALEAASRSKPDAAVTHDPAPSTPNGAEAQEQVLPHGWWRLDVTVLMARDMHRQEAATARGKPLVNPFVEIEVCGQTHRTPMVPDADLRTVEVHGVVHDTVATFNSTASFTIDEGWYGKDFMLRLYHWRPVTLFTSNPLEYSDFDIWGVPRKDGRGNALNPRLRRQLTDELNQYAKPKLLGEMRQSLEWYREHVKTGWFNLFLNGGHVIKGNLDTSVCLRFEPSVPRPETAAELRGVISRRMDVLRYRSIVNTPVPHAMPYRPRLPSSRASSRRRSRASTPVLGGLSGSDAVPPGSRDGRVPSAINIYTLPEGREPDVLTLEQEPEESEQVLQPGERTSVDVFANNPTMQPVRPRTVEGLKTVADDQHSSGPRIGGPDGVAQSVAAKAETGGRRPYSADPRSPSLRAGSTPELAPPGLLAQGEDGPEDPGLARDHAQDGARDSGGDRTPKDDVAEHTSGSEADKSSEASGGDARRRSTRGSSRVAGRGDSRDGATFRDGRTQTSLDMRVELSGSEQDEWGHGIVWFFGTEGGQVEFQNPADKGLMRVSCSSPWSRGRAENVCGRDGLPSHSDKEQESWVCVELPKHCTLVPTGYAVRHGLSGSGRVLTDWSLLGSRDGICWMPLKVHRQDIRLVVRVREAEGRARMSGSKAVSGYEGAYFAIANLPMPEDVEDPDELAAIEQERATSARVRDDIDANGGYRFFQLQTDGKDNSGLWTLACCGLEFFGQLMVDQAAIIADMYKQQGQSERRARTAVLLRSVAMRSDSEVVHALHNACHDDDPAVREHAAEGLRRLGDAPRLQFDMQTESLTVWQGDDIDGLVATEVSGSPPLELSVSPPLPRGMVLDPATGEIYGTALSPHPKTTHAVTASNLCGSATRGIDICVLPKALPVGATFEFRNDFDRLGLMHFLSTGGGRLPWSNPAQTGLVNLDTSGWMNDLHYVVGDGGRISTSFGNERAWFSIELPLGVWILPSRYSLRHGFSSSSHALRSWDLLGSVDGLDWFTLRQHRDDQTLDARFAEGTWALGKQGRPVRWFKVQLTGGNSSHGFELRCAGFEVYGPVFLDCPIRATQSSVWFMRKWGIESLVMAVAHEQASAAYVANGEEEHADVRPDDSQRDGDASEGPDPSSPKPAPSIDGPQFKIEPRQWQEALRRLDEEVGLECGGFCEQLVGLCADPDMEVQLLALSVLPLFAERGDEGAIRAGFEGLGSDRKVVREASTVLLEHVAKPGDRATFVSALNHVVDAIQNARGRKAQGGRRGSTRLGAAPGAGRHSGSGLDGVVIPPMPAGRPFKQGAEPPRRGSIGAAEAVDPEAEAVTVAALVDGLGLMVGEEDGGALLEVLKCCQAAVGGGVSETEWQAAMLPHLSRPQWYVRSTIARLLPCVVQRGDDEATNAALKLLRDSEAEVRVQAAQALARVARAGDSGIVMKLQQQLGDEDAAVRKAIAHTLGKLSGTDPVGQAIDTITLAQLGVDPEVRPTVDVKARSLLMEMGGSIPGQEGRRKSIDGIGQMRPPRRPGTGAQSASVEAFLQMHTHIARPQIPPWANQDM